MAPFASVVVQVGVAGRFRVDAIKTVPQAIQVLWEQMHIDLCGDLLGGMPEQVLDDLRRLAGVFPASRNRSRCLPKIVESEFWIETRLDKGRLIEPLVSCSLRGSQRRTDRGNFDAQEQAVPRTLAWKRSLAPAP